MIKNKYLKSYVDDDGVAFITFTHLKHNVFNIDMMEEFTHSLDLMSCNETIKCIVINADGLSWCAGVDVMDHKPLMVHSMITSFDNVFSSIKKIEVPIIAAVHGACLGGGMEIAIACDIIIASKNAVFGQPEIKLGFFPPYAVVKLPYLVGMSRAIEICTTGKKYSADEALKMGMISHVSTSEKFDDDIDKIVQEIKDCSPLIIRLNKKAIIASLGKNFDEALSYANDLFLNTLMKTQDVLEGIASFEERRKPLWKNK